MMDTTYISLVMRDRLLAPPASPPSAAPHRVESWPVEKPRERGAPSNFLYYIYLMDNIYINLVTRDRFPAPPASPPSAAPHRVGSWPAERRRERSTWLRIRVNPTRLVLGMLLVKG